MLGTPSPSTPPPGFQPAPRLQATHSWQVSCPARRGTSSLLSSSPGPGPRACHCLALRSNGCFHPALSQHPASLRGAASGRDLEFWGCSPTAPSRAHILSQSPHARPGLQSCRSRAQLGHLLCELCMGLDGPLVAVEGRGRGADVDGGLACPRPLGGKMGREAPGSRVVWGTHHGMGPDWLPLHPCAGLWRVPEPHPLPGWHWPLLTGPMGPLHGTASCQPRRVKGAKGCDCPVMHHPSGSHGQLGRVGLARKGCEQHPSAPTPVLKKAKGEKRLILSRGRGSCTPSLLPRAVGGRRPGQPRDTAGGTRGASRGAWPRRGGRGWVRGAQSCLEPPVSSTAQSALQAPGHVRDGH